MIGKPSVNRQLYAAVRDRRIRSQIMTDYWFLRALPDLESLFVPIRCTPCSIAEFSRIAGESPEVGYFLVYDGNLPPGTIDALKTSPSFATVFVEDGLRLIRITRGPRTLAPVAQPLSAVLESDADGFTALHLAVEHPEGARNVTSVITIINRTLDPHQACYFQWYRSVNAITLANDNAIGWADERRLGDAAVLRNSQCEIDMSGTSSSDSDRTMTLTVRLRFLPAFKGTAHVFALGMDGDRLSSYLDLATWRIR